MPNRSPIKTSLLRTRALIAFEALRLLLILTIIIWWGWLLVDKTQYILSLEGELVMHDANYIPLYDGNRMLTMVIGEAGTLVLLVLASSLVSFWLCIRDIRRTRALQSFFATMAHELRTPLASINLQMEGLAARGESPYLERLRQDTSRLELQLERGLELARSESGKALTLLPVELAEIWRRSASCPILPINGKPEGRVMADAHALQVIFRNIVENAVVHGGASMLDISTQGTPAEIQVVFKDNGKGSDQAQKLGKLFFKGKASKGTGVGLYLIKSLMKQMGGRAAFASTGSGFAVTLNFRRADA